MGQEWKRGRRASVGHSEGIREWFSLKKVHQIVPGLVLHGIVVAVVLYEVEEPGALYWPRDAAAAMVPWLRTIGHTWPGMNFTNSYVRDERSSKNFQPTIVRIENSAGVLHWKW